MIIRKCTSADADSLCGLWNEYAETEIVHKKMNSADFERTFFGEIQDADKLTFAAYDEKNILEGFINGSHRRGSKTAYITFAIVRREYRRKGTATALLAKLEEALSALSDIPLQSYDVIFFNPVQLEWIIPGTPGHDHPNAPGADMQSDGYIWLKNVGFRDYCTQNSFYLPLNKFNYTDQIAAALENQRSEGFDIEYYSPDRHFGMQALLENLASDDWKNTINANLAKSEPLKVLIAVDNNKKDESGRSLTIGFTGPLAVQPSGRGYFAGIGIHSEYRGHGLGKTLFSGLCRSLSEMGAGYMTLFTGEDNPARNIYASAGFKIVRSWSDMKKPVK